MSRFFVYSCSCGSKFITDKYSKEESCSECGDICRYLGSVSEDVINDGVAVCIKESKKVKVVYHDGKKKIVKVRGRKGESTSQQKAAAANARQYAHTPEADKKRSKSFKARREEKMLGI